MVKDSKEDNMGTHCDAHYGRHYVVGGNRVEDSYKDFYLSHRLDSSSLVVVDNMVGTSDGGSLAIDMTDRTCRD